MAPIFLYLYVDRVLLSYIMAATKEEMDMTKVRAIELFHKDSPFKPKVIKSKKAYNRKKLKKECA